jgi:hypothetical protein
LQMPRLKVSGLMSCNNKQGSSTYGSRHVSKGVFTSAQAEGVGPGDGTQQGGSRHVRSRSKHRARS